MEKKNVYISFVKIETKRGGDFYVTLKSYSIDGSTDLDFSKCKTTAEVLEKARAIDPDAKVIGGIILSKNEEKPNFEVAEDIEEIKNKSRNILKNFKP